MAVRGHRARNAGHRNVRVIATCLSVIAFVAIPRPARAHGLGGLSSLPVPLSYFVAGTATVLIVAFAVLTVRWPTPRWQEGPAIRRIEVPGWRVIVSLLQGLGVAGLILVVAAGLFGIPNSVRNAGPGLVWVAFWLIVPFVGVLAGDLYSLLNPWRWLIRVAGAGAVEPVAPGPRGVWPSTFAFLGFIWFEQVYPNPAHPRHVAIAAIAYTILLIGIAGWRGQQAAIGEWDAFTTYNRVISAMAPIDLDNDRGPGWRGWLRGLPVLPMPPGLSAFVVTVIGAVGFHALSASSWYVTTIDRFGPSILGSTAVLLLSVCVVASGFWLVCRYAAQEQPGLSTSTVAGRFTHVLVPVAFAFVFAHYFTVVVFEGQLLVSTLSDPLGLGWDLFGRARRPVDFTVISPVFAWWVQVAVIAVGHVLALMLVHDRSLNDFGGAGQVRARYGFLLLLVVSAGVDLALLATG